ncbi:restriction endonuclease subunit S [Noviherbaspirillum sp.]|uniref:restriction endonuclease subunit S n=1 Tax=Noviherbaspirillum sp. TaxID=1926288 RepID=UPI002FE24F55
MKPLGTFCEFKYGRSLPEKNRRGGEFPVYGSNGIVGWHDTPLTSGPTIIIGRKGSAGALQYSDKSCCPIDTTYYVDRDCTQVDLRWLFFMLQKLGLDTLNKHVAVPGLNRNDAYEKELPVPPIDEQERIAAVLAKVDELRRDRRQSLQLTEKLLQSVFINMFGDPGTNPRGWVQCSLNDLCEKIVDCPHSTPVYSDAPTNFYCVRSSDIQNGKLDLTSTRYVSETVFAERIARHEPKVGEVIYTREGGRLGYAAQIPKEKKICLGQRMMLFSAKANIASNAFLNGLLNSDSFRSKVLKLVGGGAAPRVNIKDLRAISVYRPPIEMQLRYEQFSTTLTKEEESLASSEMYLTRLFSSLQQRAFSGDLDVSRLVLDFSDDSFSASEPQSSAVKAIKPKAETQFLRAPKTIEAHLEKLDSIVGKGEAIPWSAAYFKYRILGAQSAPFSFNEVMLKAESVFDEPPPYEEIKDIILKLLDQSEGHAILNQSFDEGTDENPGRKEIIFTPVL